MHPLSLASKSSGGNKKKSETFFLMIRVTFQFNNLLIHSTAPAMHVEPFLVNSYLPSVSQGRVKLVVNHKSLDTHISQCNFPAQYH
jgi:hypothetical protein